MQLVCAPAPLGPVRKNQAWSRASAQRSSMANPFRELGRLLASCSREKGFIMVATEHNDQPLPHTETEHEQPGELFDVTHMHLQQGLGVGPDQDEYADLQRSQPD